MEPVWLDLKRAAVYVCLSERTLRRHIGHATHPLPMRIVGGKWLIHRAELDAWVQSFPKGGEEIDRLVTNLVNEVTADVKRSRSLSKAR